MGACNSTQSIETIVSTPSSTMRTLKSSKIINNKQKTISIFQNLQTPTFTSRQLQRKISESESPILYLKQSEDVQVEVDTGKPEFDCVIVSVD